MHNRGDHSEKGNKKKNSERKNVSRMWVAVKKNGV